MPTVSRAQVLSFRVRAQQLDREPGQALAGTAVLDLGAQDTGPDGGRWAVTVRGAEAGPAEELVGLWTIRGAPHLYRRADLPRVAAAVAPFSDADAGKRIFDAVKPLQAAGIPPLTALDTIAAEMRKLVTAPMVKGELSGRLAEILPEPYLRWCRPCQATHLYEQPFRLSAVRAGLELVPGTSPPVLRPIPGFAPAEPGQRGQPGQRGDRFDVIRGYLRLLGPATPKHLAEFLDSPVKEIKSHWPADAVEVTVNGETRWLLADDLDTLTAEPLTAAPETVRLLGPFDLFLQARDRSTLVTDPARAKALWPVLGRPGAVLASGELVGLWRPRAGGRKLTVQVEPWTTWSRATRGAVEEQAARLAAYRGVTLTRVDLV